MKKIHLLCLFTYINFESLALSGELAFEKPTLEITFPASERELQVDFPFTNKNKETATITRYDSGCTCVSIDSLGGKRRITPGESGTIRVVFQKGALTGTVDKAVRIWMDNDPVEEPSTQLKLRVHIPELIAIEPKTARWNLNGGSEPITVSIKFPAEVPTKVKSATISNPLFKTELKTIVEGHSYEVKVSCLSTATKALGLLKVETESTLPGQQNAQIFTLVK